MISTNANKAFILLAGLLSLWGNMEAQEIIREVELEDFYDENRLYPYRIDAPSGGNIYKSHQPALRLSESDFVYVWKPENSDSEKRMLTKYGLLLEEQWSTEFELRDDESILHLVKAAENLQIFCHEYIREVDEHRIYVRMFDLESGEEQSTRIIGTIEGKWEKAPALAFSKNNQYFVIFHYGNENDFRRIKFLFEYYNSDETMGFRALQSTYLAYSIYNGDLEKVKSDTVTLARSAKNKLSQMGGDIDDRGNFYLYSLSRDQTFRIEQHKLAGGEAQVLEYRDYPRFWLEKNEALTQFPPVLGEDEVIYIPFCDRQKRFRQGRVITRLEIAAFDFKTGEVNLRRSLPLSATELVEISKAREEAKMKPIKRLDNYIIRELRQLPDKSLLTVLQRYNYFERVRYNYTPFDLNNSRYHLPAPNILLEEILLFHFLPDGTFNRMITIPSTQRIGVLTELMGHHYEMQYREEDRTLQVLIHENDGEKYSDPMRLFHRSVDLNTGQLSERTQVFENRRRNHYFFRPYTIWLNDHVVVAMMHAATGINTQSFLISVGI